MIWLLLLSDIFYMSTLYCIVEKYNRSEFSVWWLNLEGPINIRFIHMDYTRTYSIKQIILIFIFLCSLHSVISETSKPSHIIDEQPERVHFNDFHSIMILVQESFILKQKIIRNCWLFLNSSILYKSVISETWLTKKI